MSVNDLVWIPSSIVPSLKITDDEYKQIYNNNNNTLPLFIPAILKSIKEDDIGEYSIEWDDKITVNIPLKETYLRSKQDQTIQHNNDNNNNLTILENYNDPTILDTIIKRYVSSQYLSYAGSTLLMINPINEKKFINQEKDIKLLLAMLNHYKDGSNVSSINLYQQISQIRASINSDTTCHTVFFRGASGSGKSEALKSIVQFLMLVESPNNLQNTSRSQSTSSYAPLGSSRNPLIISTDAYKTNIAISAMINLIDITWNAPTQSHMYSSRQAKSLSFIYGLNNSLKAVECNILLNGMHRFNPKDALKPYYWFALLIAGVDHSEYMITTAQRDAILPDFGLSQVQLELEFKHFEELMLKAGLELSTWTTVLRVLAALLNLKFVSIVGSDSTILSAASKNFISSAEALLGCEANAVNNLIMKKVEEKLGRTFTVDNKPNEARIALETACNALYEMIFNHLLSVCQASTYTPDYLSKDIKDRKTDTVAINLVDTVGWEIMDGMANGLSTLNINYMEERVLYNFVEHRILKEINKFSEEEIQLTGVDVPQFQIFLDLFEKPSTSIFSVLDDITALPRGDDKGFTDKLISNNPKSDFVKKAPPTVKGKLCFTIKHSFGDVSYDADGFVYNNRLKISQQTKNFIKVLNIPFLVEEEQVNEAITLAPADGKARPKPIGGSSNKDNMIFKYKERLLKFIAQYDNTQTHHILCVRPKIDLKGPQDFDSEVIGKQITQLGISSLLQLGKAGFSSSRKYVDFFKRYRSVLSFTYPLIVELSDVSDKEHMRLSKELLEACIKLGSPSETFDDVKSAPVFGKTRLFLKSPLDNYLEAFRTKMLESKQASAVLLQSKYRMHVEKSKFSKFRSWLIKVQSFVRKFRAQQAYSKTVKAAASIKNRYMTYKKSQLLDLMKVSINIIKLKFYRRFRLKIKYKRLQAHLHAFQQLARGFIIRKRVQAIEGYVKKMQYVARRFIAKVRWLKICNKAALSIQTPLRGRLCRLRNNDVLVELTKRRDLRTGTRATIKLQCRWRGRFTRERIRSVFAATKTLQRWMVTKMQRKRYLNILKITLWLQCHARRIRDRNVSRNKQIRLMLREIQIRLVALRDQEISAVSDIPMNELYLGSGTARLSGSLSAKYDRRILSFDVAYDVEIAYPRGWLNSIQTFSRDLKVNKKRSFYKVAVGSLHTIIIDNMHNIYTMGINDEGQLGHNNRQNQQIPTIIEHTEALFKSDASTLLSKGPNFKLSIEDVCCGNDHTLIRTGFGRIFAWGSNRRGQLGIGTFEFCAKPKVVSSLKNVKQISCGAFHCSCVVEPGILYNWGASECLVREKDVADGGTDACSPVRIDIEKAKRVFSTCCGEFQTIVSCSTGIYSWGSNKHGELGCGDRLTRFKPVKVCLPELSSVQLQGASIYTGGKHFALTIEGSLWTWGWNKYGQVGTGSTYDILKPVLISMPSNKAVTKTICSRKSTTVLLHSGDIYMFGLGTLLNSFSTGKVYTPLLLPTLICPRTDNEKYSSLEVINSGSMSIITADVVSIVLPPAPVSPVKNAIRERAFKNVYSCDGSMKDKEISFTLKPDEVQTELSKMGKMMLGKVSPTKTKAPLPPPPPLRRLFKKKEVPKVPDVVTRRSTLRFERRSKEGSVTREQLFALFDPLATKKHTTIKDEKIME